MGRGAATLDGAGSPDVPRPAVASGRTLYLPVEPASVSPLRPKVTLVTEGTYPYYWGGVSTWCHALVHGLPDVDFTILSIISDPNREPLFELPPELPVVAVPMWGTRQAFEVGAAHAGGVRIPRPTVRVAPAFVETEILPPLRGFLRAIWCDEPDVAALRSAIVGLHAGFLRYGFDPVMRDPAVWEAFRSASVEAFPGAAARAGYRDAPLSVSDVARGFQVVMRWLQPLGLAYPPTDVVHAAMAGVCSLVAIAIQHEQRAAFFLSEHGIYLREALLAGSRSRRSLFLKLLTLGFARQVTRLSYAAADQISPCCDDHKRWELRLGAPPDRVRTLYYGVDPSVFQPADRPRGRPPTVVWVGRIDPLKDVETLLQAAALVRDVRPDVRFRLFGSAPPGNEEYDERCRALHRRLGLEDTVVFEGFTSSPADAFNQGDVALLTSISEGFPYSTLEAMLCGRPIVATDVGGLGEQVGECGVIVEPRNPEGIARALLEVLGDGRRLDLLGWCARSRSSRLFSLDGFLEQHRQAFRTLAITHRPIPEPVRDMGDVPSVSVEPVGGSLGRDELVETLVARVPMPADPLEVAAVLESTGVTAAAAKRYGADDTFTLAEQVLGGLLERADRHPPPYDPVEHAPRRRPARSLAAVLGGLVPALAAALVLVGWSGAGTDAEAAIFGMLAGLVVSNAMLQALTPRTSLYVGCENWVGVRHMVHSFWAVTAPLIGAAAIAIPTASLLVTGTTDAAGTFAVGFGAIALFWISTGGLFALGRQGRAAAGVVAGFAVGCGVVIVSGPSDAGVLGGVAAGLATTVGVVVFDTGRLLRRLDAHRQPLLGIPSRLTIVRESTPHAVFGLLVMGIMISPHALVLLDSRGSLVNPRVFQFELAVNLALLPLLASAPCADRVMERFWERVGRVGIATPAADPGACSERMTALASDASRALTSFLLIATGVFLFAIEVALAELGGRAASLGIVDVEAFQATLLAALITYVFLGSGLLASGTVSSLGAPWHSAATAGAGVLVVIAVGAALGPGAPLEMAVVATALGAVAFAVTSGRVRASLMERAVARLVVRM